TCPDANRAAMTGDSFHGVSCSFTQFHAFCEFWAVLALHAVSAMRLVGIMNHSVLRDTIFPSAVLVSCPSHARRCAPTTHPQPLVERSRRRAARAAGLGSGFCGEPGQAAGAKRCDGGAEECHSERGRAADHGTTSTSTVAWTPPCGGDGGGA